MKDVIRLLAKEVRRIRVLIEVMERYNDSIHSLCYRKKEIETLKRILAIAIKKSLTFH